MARQRMPQPAVIPVPPGDEEVIDGPVKVEDMSEGYQLAYQRAILKGCSPKGAHLYADAHGEDFEPAEAAAEPTEDEIKAEIARLQEKLDAAS